MKSPPVLFAGPTLRGVELCDVGQILHRPPVRRGSIHALLDEIPTPGVMIVADGTFHQYPSVGHAEIGRALDAGWEVWGVSSMGAIRAAEMRNLGMRGFGAVYERYVADPDFRDDEVALLHGNGPPFTPVTEPLIHIRSLLSDLVRREVVSPLQAEAVSDHLESLWYGYRTPEILHTLLCDEAGLLPKVAEAEVSQMDRFRTKTHDLLALLATRPWTR